MSAPDKHCSVAYALPDRQFLWEVTVPAAATVAQVLAAARSRVVEPDVPWDCAEVGIFGIRCARETVPVDGDRIELYRPLTTDPKESRRARARDRAGAAARDRDPASPSRPARSSRE